MKIIQQRRFAENLTFFGLMAVGLASAAPAAPVAHAEAGSSWLQRVGVEVVVGSGKVQTEARKVSGFSAIALQGSMKLVLRQGAREGVEVRADDNLLALIETRVVDRSGVPTLEIGAKSGSSYSTRREITVVVDLVTLQALSVTGSGDATSEGLKAAKLNLAITGSGDVRLRQLGVDELSIKISGSGDVDVAGRTAKLGVVINGSGDVRARDLDAQDVSISIAGSGNASVTARKSLAVSIAGSGDVVYAGDATVKSAIAGAGSVKKR